ncbi:MAG TPA: cytochrome P450 [Ktedonobacteraceae bacterium]|nr:cytochrome P450 [Ktedonobacteraceae bacterium]
MDHFVLPPGPKGLPFLGNVFQMDHNLLGFILDVQREYGRMATIHIGRTPIVLLFRPEHIRYVLVENPRNFTNREVAGGLIFGKLFLFSLLTPIFSDKVATGLRNLVGDWLLTTDGEYHDQQRRLLQPTFSRRYVENYTDLIVQYTRETVETWRPGMEIDLAREMQSIILRLIFKILVNIDLLEEKTDIVGYINTIMSQPTSMIEGLLSLPLNLPFVSFGKRNAAISKIDTFFYALIDRRVAGSQEVGDVLSTLLASKDENGNKMTRKQIRDALVSLTAAGHETTTNSLIWTMYLLSRHPAVFEKVQAELRTVLGGRDPRLSDLPQLTYLDQVIKESMRLYPSGWTQGRCAVADFELDGYRFPAGTLLMFSQWALHRNPDIWEDTDTFRPERWEPDLKQKGLQWAYVPFGGGSRVCLGRSLALLELSLILPVLLQRYFPRVLPGHIVEPLPLITLRSKNGMPVRLEPVQNSPLNVAESIEARKDGKKCPFAHPIGSS